jgi:hypothetical protein
MAARVINRTPVGRPAGYAASQAPALEAEDALGLALCTFRSSGKFRA